MPLSEFDDLVNRKRVLIGGKRNVGGANIRTEPEKKFIRRQIDKQRARGRKL